MSDLFTEFLPSHLFQGDPGEYATADDLLTLSDLFEQDVTIRRWHKNGRPLKLRIRALDLDQQDRILADAMVKNERTGLWESSEAIYCAASLRELCAIPHLNDAQAQQMRKHNPTIIKALVRYGWLLSALDDERLEAEAAKLAEQSATTESDAAGGA